MILVYMGLAVLFLMVGVVIGRYLRGDNPDRLSRDERKELHTLRNVLNELSSSAAEHAVLGDDFAVIVTHRINQMRSNPK